MTTTQVPTDEAVQDLLNLYHITDEDLQRVKVLGRPAIVPRSSHDGEQGFSCDRIYERSATPNTNPCGWIKLRALLRCQRSRQTTSVSF